MLHYLRGTIEKKSITSVIIDVNGHGYEIMAPFSTIEKLSCGAAPVKIFVVESVAMYGGAVTLYGFLSDEEKNIFLLLKEHVPGAGARKAIDYLDKVTKSLPDFRRSIIAKDIAALTSIFGFTKKTAEKLVSALHDKIGDIILSGKEKWVPRAESTPRYEAIEGLIALGYRETQAREAVDRVIGAGATLPGVETLIRQALKQI